MKLAELKRMVLQDLEYLVEEKVFITCMTELDRDAKAPAKDIVIHKQCRRNADELSSHEPDCFALNHRNLLWYNECISSAPNQSEDLAITYEGKSAVLLRMRKYQECICEIDRALSITQSTTLKVKLLCRKAKCLTALDSPDNRAYLEKARFFIAKVEGSKMKKKLRELVKETQSIIDNDKLDKPRENRRKIQSSEVIAEAEKTDIWDSIRVEYSAVLGRHLVAARDFKAGEIILCEKPYRNQLDSTTSHLYCYNCFTYLWTAVPCDSCGSRLFCSEQCKNKAVEEYHGMECRVLHRLDCALRSEYGNAVALIVTIFCKAYNEVGSIDLMQTQIESLEKIEDKYCGEIPREQLFTDYRSVYTSRCRKFNKQELDECIRNASVALMGLAKYSNIFGKKYAFNEAKKLMKNDAAIFVGALLLKFNLVTVSKLTQIYLPDPSGRCNDPNPSESVGLDLILNPTTLMASLGCVPNVHSCAASGVKVVTYALQPIKKGTKLYLYQPGTIYDGVPKLTRQARFFKNYNSQCVCEACTKNWSDILDDSNKLAVMNLSKSGPAVAKEFHDKIDAITAEFKAISDQKPNQPDIKLVRRIRELVSQIWEHFSLPAPVVTRAVKLMTQINVKFYSP